MSVKSLLMCAAVALVVVVAYDKTKGKLPAVGGSSGVKYGV